jgi:hypothetical protein
MYAAHAVCGNPAKGDYRFRILTINHAEKDTMDFLIKQDGLSDCQNFRKFQQPWLISHKIRHPPFRHG